MHKLVRMVKCKLAALAVATSMMVTPLVALPNAIADDGNTDTSHSVAESIIIDKGSNDGSKVVRPDSTHDDIPIFANYLNGFRGTGPGAKSHDPNTNAQVKITNISGNRDLFTITFEYSGASTLFISEPRGLDLQKSDGNNGYVDNPTYEIVTHDVKDPEQTKTITPSDILSQKEPFRGSALSGVHNDFYKGYMSFMQYDKHSKSFTQNPLTHAKNYQYWPASREDFPALMSLTQTYDITQGINNVYIYNTSRFEHKQASLTFKVRAPFKYGYGAVYPVRITAYLPNNNLGRYSYSNWVNYVTAYYNAPVIYCLNRHYAFPPSHKEVVGSENQLTPVDYSTDNYFNPVVPSPKFNNATKDQIAWIMRLGYPYDGAKFFNNGIRKNASSEEQGYYYKAYEQNDYEKATQQAIWHLTDNIPIVDKKIDNRANFVINKLLELSKKKVEEDQKKNPKTTADDADKFETFYLDNNNHKVPGADRLYQNFIGLRYKNPSNPVKGKVNITKYDGSKNKPIMSGAKFDVYEGYYTKENASQLTKTQSNASITNGSVALNNLKINQAYSLVETQTPRGFKASDPVIFRIAQVYRSGKRIDEGTFYHADALPLYRLEKFGVNDDGEPSWIPVKDEQGKEKPAFNLEDMSSTVPELRVDNYPPIDLKVNKVDGVSMSPLSGAEFTLVEGKDASAVTSAGASNGDSNNGVDSVSNPSGSPSTPNNDASDGSSSFTWTSNGTPHTVKVAREKVYTLVETKAPSGHRKAAPITFKIGKDGAIYRFDGAIQYEYAKPSGTPQLDVKNFPEGVALIRTKAQVNGKQATEGKPVVLQGTEVNSATGFKDTIIYDGLVPNTEYTITTKLWVLNEDGTKQKVQKSMMSKFTPENSKGEHTVEFGNNYQDVRLYGNKQGRYLFTEKLESTKPVNINGKMQTQVLVHDDPFDMAQTIETTSNNGTPPFVSSENGTLKTVVTSGEHSASASEPLKIGANTGQYTFTDTVEYTGLHANEPYTVTAELMDMSSNQPSKVGEPVMKKFTPKENEVNGKLEMTFTNYTLQAGKRYMVWEKIESDNAILEKKTVDAFGGTQTTQAKQTLVEHETGSTSQTIVVEKPENPKTPPEDSEPRNPAIKTTVIVNEHVKSSSSQAATISPSLSKSDDGLSFVDRVSYKDLKAGQRYAVVGQLMELGSNNTVEDHEPTVVKATASAFFVAKPGSEYNDSNIVDVHFTNVKDLKEDYKYVVYEVVVPLAQVQLDETGSHVITPFNEIVAMEGAVKHTDKSDKAQMLLTDNTEVNTVVQYGLKSASSGVPLSIYEQKTSFIISDNISVTGGFDSHKPYKVFARMVEKATKKVIHETTDTIEDNPTTIDFGEVSVKPNTEYVITEALVPASTHATSYEDALTKPGLILHDSLATKSQTLFNHIPEIKTTVKAYANDKKKTLEADSYDAVHVYATNDELKAGVPVTDTISYRGLNPDSEYVAYGRLMRIEDGKEPVEVAHKSLEFTPNEGVDFNDKNTVQVDFGMVKGLTSGKYVVFESLSEKTYAQVDKSTDKVTFTNSSQVVKHENADDLAQTVLVTRVLQSELKTVVTADNVSASLGNSSVDSSSETASQSREAAIAKTPEELKAGVHVVDKVLYKDFVEGAKYTLFGRLMKVANEDGDPLQSPQEVASAWQIFTAKGNPDYADSNMVNLDFGMVKNLTAGKYVVFESAAPSETTLINDKHVNMRNIPNYDSKSPEYPTATSGVNERVTFTDGVLEHANAHDLAQTVVVTVHVPDDSMGAIKTTASASVTKSSDGTSGAGGDSGATSTQTVTASDSDSAKLSATDEQLKNGVHVVDKVSYKGLIPGNTYHVFGQLQKVSSTSSAGVSGSSSDTSHTTVTPVGTVAHASFTAGEHADKTEYDDVNVVTVDFGTLKNLDAANYVVYEVLVPDTLLQQQHKTAEQITTLEQAKDVLKTAASSATSGDSGTTSPAKPANAKYAGFVHENPRDNAQTVVITKVVVPPPVLRTVVSSGTHKSSENTPFSVNAGHVPVVDTVTYEHLKPNTDYVLYGRLMRVSKTAESGTQEGISHNAAPNTATAVDHATAYLVFTTNQSGSGSVTLDFGSLNLTAGTYVVFESASVATNAHVNGVSKLSSGNHGTDKTVTFTDSKLVVKHENADDKAQTFVLKPVPPAPPKPHVPPKKPPVTPPTPPKPPVTPPVHPVPPKPVNPPVVPKPPTPTPPSPTPAPPAPHKPVEPPHKPTVPKEPHKPSKPEKPEQPTKPDKPTVPVPPCQPNNPGNPVNPHVPPNTPGQPGVPTVPGKPTEPSNPGEPGKPTRPGTQIPPCPVEPPAKPVMPKPSTPTKPRPNHELPKTGSSVRNVALGMGMLALLSVAITALRRKARK